MKKRIKKKLKKIKKSIKKNTRKTVKKLKRLKKFPPALVENRMLFETNDDFTDNGRALFDYLIENGYNKKYEMVWLVHDPSKYKEYQY